MKIEPIAKIYNGYCDKFGIPRQSGLAPSVISYIVFEEKYRSKEALRGIEEYSHLWLLWHFSKAKGSEGFTPTVRPPRLGGNKRVGVFATRSPNRPNGIGLSSVKLDGMEYSKKHGYVLRVLGADILSGTDIFDIKPYIPYTDLHPNAKGSFAEENSGYSLEVRFNADISAVSRKDIEDLTDILKGDPRPSYKDGGDRIYTLDYKKYKVSFKVTDGVLYVTEILEGIGEEFSL